MALDFFRRSPMLILPVVALAIFMLVFFAVTLRTLLTKKQNYEAVARLPLEAEENGRE
jgi:hypothetical protein